MRISKTNNLHPVTEKKQENLHATLEKRMDQLLFDLNNSTMDKEELVDELEDWVLGLIDEALWPDQRNTLTIGHGDSDEITVPCFTN